MFEYLDMRVFGATIVLVFVIILATMGSKYQFRYFIASVLFIIGLNIYVALETQTKIQTNIALFKDKKRFVCVGDDKNSYRISSGKWQIDGDSFVKDSLMIRSDRCEER